TWRPRECVPDAGVFVQKTRKLLCGYFLGCQGKRSRNTRAPKSFTFGKPFGLGPGRTHHVLNRARNGYQSMPLPLDVPLALAQRPTESQPPLDRLEFGFSTPSP